VPQSTKEKSTEPELMMAKQLSLDVNPIDLREPLLNAAQAAKMLSVRASWVADAARSGHLPCVRDRQARPLPALRPRALGGRAPKLTAGPATAH
jgi:hypothetical protein